MSSSIHFIGGAPKLVTQNSIESNKLKESQENAIKQIVFPIGNATLAGMTPTPIMMNDSVSSQNHVLASNAMNISPINLVAISTTVSNSPATMNLVHGSIVTSNSDVPYSSASNVITMPSVIAPSVTTSSFISGTSHIFKTTGPIKRVEPHHMSPIQIKPQFISRPVNNTKSTITAPRILPIGEGVIKSTMKSSSISSGSSSNVTNSIITGSSSSGTTNPPITQRLVIHSKTSKVFLAPSNKFSPNFRPTVSLPNRPQYSVASNTVLVSPTILPAVSSTIHANNLTDSEANSDTTVTVSTSDISDSRSLSPPQTTPLSQPPTPSILTRKRPLDENPTAIFALIKPSDSSQHTVISRSNTLPKSITSHAESSPSRKRSRKQHLAEIRSEQPVSTTISSTVVVSTPSAVNSAASLTISTTNSNSSNAAASLHTQLSSMCSPISIHPAVSNSGITKPTVRLITDSSSISNSNIGNDSAANPTNIIMYSFINPNSAAGSVTHQGHIIPTILPNDGHLVHHDHYSTSANATILEGAEETVTSSGLSQQEMLEQQCISKHFPNLPSSGHQHVGEMSLLTPPISNHNDTYSMLQYNEATSARVTKPLSGDEESNHTNLTHYSGFFNYKRLSLSDKCSWDPRPNHYESYSDVRPRKEIKQGVNEVYYQKDMRRRTLGWPLSRVVGQYYNLIEVENENIEKLDQFRNLISSGSSSSRKDDSNKVMDLIDEICKQKKFMVENLMKVSDSANRLIEDNWSVALDIVEKSKSRRPIRRK